ncbi:MAG TPA: hypothetical protein VHM70_04950 [Polyangiaceae bacterium]|jgi:hypothetical protein|nr:hypothetical protein [Polyangiaceae bacterium]
MPLLPNSKGGLALVALALCSGCYHYQVNAVHQPTGIEADRRGESAVLWSWFWGTLQENFDTTKSCLGLPMKSVTTHSNLGYSLITVLSLGIAAPIKVTWVCAKEPGPVVDGDNPNDPI